MQPIIDAVWNFYFNVEGKTNYPAIIITLSVISIFATITWYYILSRNKLKIKTTYVANIPEYVGGVLGQSIPIFSSYITNKSRRTIYISQISIKLNTMINGNDEFQYINVSAPVSFPIRIESSERYIYECDMVSLNNRLLNQSNSISWFRVLIFDTLGKRYRSKKVHVDIFRQYMNNILRH